MYADYGKIVTYFRSEKKVMILITISGLIYNFGMIVGPWFEGQMAQYLVDIMQGRRYKLDMLYLAIYYVIAIMFVQGARYIKRFYVRRLGNNVNRNMKQVLYAGLLNEAGSDTKNEETGVLMTKAISDVDACSEGVRKFVTEFFDTGVVMIAYISLLFYYDWRLAILSCIFPPMAYVIAEKLKGIVQKCVCAYRESSGELNSLTLDRISLALTYRIFGCETQRDKTYDECLNDYEKKAVFANVWGQALQPIYHTIAMFSVFFILWFGGKNVLGVGWKVWNIASFTTFLSCFSKLAVKSSKAGNLFNAVHKAQVSWDRIKPLLSAREKVVQEVYDDFQKQEHKTYKDSKLTVNDLSFQYTNEPEILHSISFHLRTGEIIGVTGPVACGKSTLGKVFLCENPYTGSILFNGRELSQIPIRERQTMVAYMGHQPELLSDSIEQNILLGDQGDIQKYLRMCCMDREVSNMPHKELTQVGSKGVCLSGGQKARIALARTIMHKRPLIVLDDPFAAVDKETEKQLLNNLRSETVDCMVLLISHRLSLFPNLDGVLWMEDGNIVQSSHEELMNKSTEYRTLYELQINSDDYVNEHHANEHLEMEVYHEEKNE